MASQMGLELEPARYVYGLAVNALELDEMIAGRVPEAVRLELLEMRGQMSESPAAAIKRAIAQCEQREARSA